MHHLPEEIKKTGKKPKSSTFMVSTVGMGIAATLILSTLTTTLVKAMI